MKSCNSPISGTPLTWICLMCCLCVLGAQSAWAQDPDGTSPPTPDAKRDVIQNIEPIEGGTLEGACCMPDGSCVAPMTQTDCGDAAGFFQGLATDCADVACDGACCLANGTCSITTAADCGGTWQGYGTDCDCIDCNIGACCIPSADPFNDDCDDSFNRALCEAQGGVYLGGGTTCDDASGAIPYCEVFEATFYAELGLNEILIDVPQFMTMNAGGNERVLRKVIFYIDSQIHGWAQIENQSADTVCTGCFVDINVSETFDFRNLVIDPLVYLADLTVPDPGLLPSDGVPNQGPDYFLFPGFSFCEGHGDQITSGLAPYIGNGDIVLTYAASGSVQWSCSLCEVQQLVDDLVTTARIRVAYLYEVQEGACCDPCDGTCEDAVSQSECEAGGGIYQGDGILCDDVVCPEIGACCDPCDGSCTDDVTQAFCEDTLGGVYQGNCSKCVDIDCPVVGACCDPCDGTCIGEMSPTECTQAGGIYQGDCTTCAGVTCPEKGACCDPCSGVCTPDLSPSECSAQGGIYQGDCSDCGDIVCPELGACCDPCDGSCEDNLTEADCLDGGGIWQGPCSICSPGLCPLVGACCFPGEDPDCVDGITEDECIDQGGENFTPCASCDDIVCIKGACCIGQDDCVDNVYEEECDDLGGISFHPDLTCDEVDCDPQCRIQCADKGSLIIFSKVEVRWRPDGTLVQDTFIQLSNDYPDDVKIQFYFINGDDPIVDHPGWNFVDNLITLTGNQPTGWSAASGSGIVSPWSVLDPADGVNPPGRPADDGTGDWYLRGWIVGWAVNNDGEEIRWNHLSGTGTLVYYRDGSAAWEYNACTSRVNNSLIANGDPTGTPGILNLDGEEYCMGPSLLLMNFQAVGSSAYGYTDGMTVVSDTDVTLHPIDGNFDPDSGASPVSTKAHWDVWNENENKLSGAYRCITCWDQTLLSQYGIPNHFLLTALQSDHGKARVDGIGSPLCDDSEATPLLGLVARWLDFDGSDIAASGVNMINMGYQPAVITAPLMGGDPPESNEGDAIARPVNPFEAIDELIIQLIEDATQRSSASNR